MQGKLFRQVIRSVPRIALFAVTMNAAVGESQSAEPKPQKPNVIVILADDLGYGEIGFNGRADIPTPNIDRFAKNGTVLSDGYVSCPVCSPTRAGLLTSRYQQRFGHEFNTGQPAEGQAIGLPLTETTIANRLKDAGYATAAIGKWHLGSGPEFHPQQRGFDEFYGFPGGAHPYLPGRGTRNNPIVRNKDVVAEPEFLTDTIAAESAAFIDRQKDQPFFLYAAFNAVHGPLEATDKYLSRFPNIEDEKRRTFAAMLSALDDAVGVILDKVAEHKLEENTLIFFLSDNGGPTKVTTSRNDPLSGYKGTVLEGGIRVPFAVQWPGHIPAGQVYRQPVISLDIGATAAAAAGVELASGQGIDGVNLLPYLTGKDNKPPHDQLYWRFGPQHAVRQGDYKLVQLPNEEPKLFDVVKDPAEQNDLAAKEPEKVKELQAVFASWNDQLEEPRWRARKANGGNRRQNADRPNGKARKKAAAQDAN